MISSKLSDAVILRKLQTSLEAHFVLRELFPGGRFRAPANEAQIAEVEGWLGLRLPQQLRELYFECDGFREDRGNSKYLLSLIDYDHIGSLVATTVFFWTEWNDRIPKLRDYVFFGSSAGDESWGINWKRPGEIIAYHFHMGDEYDIVGNSIIELYQQDYARYEDV